MRYVKCIISEQIMKRFIIFCIAFTMTFTLACPSFAVSTDLEETESTKVEPLTASAMIEKFNLENVSEGDVEVALATFNTMGLSHDSISTIDKENGDTVYTFSLYDDIKSEIVVEEQSNHDVVLDITEGNKHDELTLTHDGRVLLDGNEVTFDVSTENNGDISLYGSLSDTWYTGTNPCPSKTWVYQYNTNKASISASKKIENCTTAVIIGLISMALSPVGTVFAGVYSIAASVIAAATGTDSKYMSAKVATYYPKGGRNIGNNRWVEKHVGKFYPKKNYKGTATTKTRYEITQYY